MNVIENEIYAAIEKELRAATERFGLHHSWHEKYAVTLEEVRELDEDVKVLWHELEVAFRMTMQNAPDSEIEQQYECMYDCAKRATIECSQVAAMCKKAVSKFTQARWLVSSDGYYPYCSNCGARTQKMTKYCAECGRKMRKEVNDGESS